MTKILQGNLHKVINVVVERKVYATVRFNENGIYETTDDVIIKELREYGYKVVDEPKTEEITVKPKRRVKDID